MKLLLRTTLVAFVCVILLCIVSLKISNGPHPSWQQEVSENVSDFKDKEQLHFEVAEKNSNPGLGPPNIIHLVLVVCGDRSAQALTSIKSALLFAKAELKIHLFVEETLRSRLESELTAWQKTFPRTWSFDIEGIKFPVESQNEWKKLFKPCAAQRLFLPSVMEDVDAVIYVDVDVLFLSPPDLLWSHFGQMNASQVAALVPESEDFATGWYNRFARHPYYGELGVNSGVMLMNLTRLRSFHWDSYIVPTYQHYKFNITWGDQDIINIIFHYHSDKLYILPCEYNYRPDHCMYMSVCRTAETNGVHVLHGNRGAFINDKQPAFKAFYDSFLEFELGKDILTDLLQPLASRLNEASLTSCGKVQNLLLKNLEHGLV